MCTLEIGYFNAILVPKNLMKYERLNFLREMTSAFKLNTAVAAFFSIEVETLWRLKRSLEKSVRNAVAIVQLHHLGFFPM